MCVIGIPLHGSLFGLQVPWNNILLARRDLACASPGLQFPISGLLRQVLVADAQCAFNSSLPPPLQAAASSVLLML